MQSGLLILLSFNLVQDILFFDVPKLINFFYFCKDKKHVMFMFFFIYVDNMKREQVRKQRIN